METRVIDWKQILIRYICHVGDCEGTYFLYKSTAYTLGLTEEEMEDLRKEADQYG